MTYATQGTCSREINFDVEDNKLRNVSFKGGCNGNLKGIGKLVEGQEVADQMAVLPTNYRDRPLDDQKIKRVTVETFGKEYEEPVKLNQKKG